MLDGRPLVDVHLHPARRDTLKPSWDAWLQGFDSRELDALYDGPAIDKARFDAMLEAEGVDIAVVFAEYSPKVTGIQPIEDLLPLATDRVKMVANVNPHYHYPVDEETSRQLGLGAVALKIHPVHAGVAANDRCLYPAYEVCQSAGVPVVVHCGTSTFPGSSNSFADPCCSTTCCATSTGWMWCSRTADGAGGMTPRRSWPWRTSGYGSSCPVCRRPGCASTTHGTTGPG
jgi:predicted TIM-barrel fold metal-dependent hydrolase